MPSPRGGVPRAPGLERRLAIYQSPSGTLKISSGLRAALDPRRSRAHAERTPLDISTAKGLGLTALAVLDLVAIGRLLLRAHGFEGSLTWILGIVAFPGVGALAYLTLASPRMVTTTRRKQSSASAWRREGLDKGALELGSVEYADELERLASALTALPPTADNQVELLTEDAAAFEQIEAAITSARESIWTEYYIVRNDETGRRFLDLLTRKAQQGLQVCLLFDAVGSAGLDARRLKALHAAGGRAVAFLPMNPMRRRWSVNLRNHRKMILIDGEIGFTGGMNVGDEYSGRSRLKGLQSFHDTHLSLRGPAAMHLALIFAEDWSFATDEHLPHPRPRESFGAGTGARLSVIPSGPDQEFNASRLLYFASINHARARAWISSPYFIPDQATRQALMVAAMRGVDVRLLIPSRCDIWLVGLAVRASLRDLLRAKVRIFEYLPTMLHAKTIVIDSLWGLVGSANVDMRSFSLNFELGALVRDESFAADLERRFCADLDQSREMTLADCEGQGPLRRLLHGAASLLSPLL